MSGYGPTDGLMLAAMAIAVVLLAIVSLVGTSTRRRNVIEGEARTVDLAELTGILDPKLLQDTFGPPDMGRVWRSVSLQEVSRARRPIGWLLSSDLVDYAGIIISIAALIVPFYAVKEFLSVGVVLALIGQVSGWVLSTRLPK